jgi:flavin-binding protein dodecin
LVAVSDDVYKKIEVVGTSTQSVTDAIENAVDKARESIDDLRWYEVSEARGLIEGDRVEHQVSIKVGFNVKT